MNTTMNTTVGQFLASLVGVREWNKQFAQIGQWAEAGEVETLLALAAELTGTAGGANIQEVMRRSILDAVERILALTPTLACAEAALSVSLMRAKRGWPSARGRQDMASLFAQAQTPETLDALFERYGKDARHREMLARLTQEMVLRAVAASGATSAFWEGEVMASHHPLAWLPLTLLAEERSLPRYLPRNGPQGKSWATPSAQETAPEPKLSLEHGLFTAAETSPSAVRASWVVEDLHEGDVMRLRSAVANWEQESNGMIEARVLRADAAVAAGALTPAAVLSLPMECLAGASEADLWFVFYSVADALASLFAAACNGGAYNSGHGGAYGRLMVWRSAGALVGADEGASIGSVAALAGRCAWFSFSAKSAWFYEVAWDLGLMALRPDGRALAMLAATDTD